MLVIRRKAGDAVLIGDTVAVTILDTTASSVTLGFEAPSDVVILRKELSVSMQLNQAAAMVQLPPMTERGGRVSVKTWD